MAKYQKESLEMMYLYQKITVHTCAKYAFKGITHIYVTKVTDDNHIVGYNCHGELFELVPGTDNFCRYYPMFRSSRT